MKEKNNLTIRKWLGNIYWCLFLIGVCLSGIDVIRMIAIAIIIPLFSVSPTVLYWGGTIFLVIAVFVAIIERIFYSLSSERKEIRKAHPRVIREMMKGDDVSVRAIDGDRWGQRS